MGVSVGGKRWIVGFMLALLGAGMALSACSSYEPPKRIALLAPFEGRYREIGYNALYAARLAMADAGTQRVELMAVDDGGSAASAASAADRARALTKDPLVLSVVTLGYAASDADTQRDLGDISALVVGEWGAQPETASVFMLASPQTADQLTTPAMVSITAAAELPVPVIGGDVFALEQFPKLREALEGVTVISSGSLPDADFQARYLASAEFAPEPGLLATLTYDAVSMAVLAVDGSATRAETLARLSGMTYEGVNGTIRFENGYWVDAPIYRYQYGADRLLHRVDAEQ